MTSQPRGLQSSTPSAAREALQSNLDNTLTLNRKKSWFGSARDAFQRGAKGVVGHLRTAGDRKGSYVDDQENEYPDDDDGSSSRHGTGADDDSLTPLRASHAELQKTSTPKGTMSSLRQHINASGRNKGKRGALSDITTVGANESRGSGSLGPLVTKAHASHDNTEIEEKSPTKQHGRKSSVAKSMIGSLRSLSRKGPMSKPTSPASDGASPLRGAFAIPLPSSPINIPAPTLNLNLGDAANISTSFLHRAEFSQDAELTVGTDLATNRTCLMGDVRQHSSPVSTGQFDSRRKRPAGELEMPINNFGFGPGADPVTPMPGTNTGMDLDGSFDLFHEPPLFERSVEAQDTPEKREDKGLKKMISLDALAEQHIKDSPLRGIRLTPASARAKRDFSAVTVQTCPSDMPPLTRQLAALSANSADHGDSVTGFWRRGDPFGPESAIGGLAASSALTSTKETAVPGRPKTTVQTADMPMSPSEGSSPCLNDASAETVKLSEDEMLLGQLQARIIAARAVVSHTAQPNPIDTAQQVPSVQQSLSMLKASTTASSPTSSRLSSAQYDQFHAEHFLGLQECHRADPPPSIVDTDDQMSLHCRGTYDNVREKGELVDQHAVDAQPQSANTLNSNSGNSEEVGDVFLGCSMQAWMQKGENGTAADLRPPPHQQSPAGSVDSISDARPPIGPTLASPEHTPSMGDRLRLEFERSNRNMRYNALTDASNESVAEYGEGSRTGTSAFPPPVGHYATLQAEDSEVEQYGGSSSLNFESVFPASARPSPKGKRSQKIGDYCPSSDSIEAALEEAITDHYVFQSALAGVEVTEYPALSGMTADVKGDERDRELEKVSGLGSEYLGEAAEPADVMDGPPAPTSVTEPFPEPGADDLTSSNPEGIPGKASVADEPASRHLTALPTDDDSLDDCLDLYKSYEACQGRFPGDNPSSEIESPEHREFQYVQRGEASSPSESTASAASPTSLGSPMRRTPARYRSVKSKKSTGMKSNHQDS